MRVLRRVRTCSRSPRISKEETEVVYVCYFDPTRRRSRAGSRRLFCLAEADAYDEGSASNDSVKPLSPEQRVAVLRAVGLGEEWGVIGCAKDSSAARAARRCARARRGKSVRHLTMKACIRTGKSVRLGRTSSKGGRVASQGNESERSTTLHNIMNVGTFDYTPPHFVRGVP